MVQEPIEAEIDKNAKPTRMVRFVFSFIVTLQLTIVSCILSYNTAFFNIKKTAGFPCGFLYYLYKGNFSQIAATVS